MTHDIETWFLILSLFIPRITIILAMGCHSIPFNAVPFILDFLMAMLAPRFLILIYIFQNYGIGGWFLLHLIVYIMLIYNEKESTDSFHLIR
jgi:hypothetical protein